MRHMYVKHRMRWIGWESEAFRYLFWCRRIATVGSLADAGSKGKQKRVFGGADRVARLVTTVCHSRGHRKR